MKPSRISARKTALLRAKPTHDAEIDRHQPAIGAEEQIAGVHVGVEEAIPQRMTQEALHDLAAEIRQVDIGGGEALMIVQRDAIDPFHRQHAMRRAIPIDGRDAEVRIVAGVFGHLRQGRSLEPQIHLHRDRARHRVDDLDQPQTACFGRQGFRMFGREVEIGEIALEPRTDVRPENLDGDAALPAVAVDDVGAVDLGNRRRGDRRAEIDKGLIQRSLKRAGDDGLRFRLRERRQPVLQAFQVARHRDADDIRAGRKELAELEIGRAEPRQSGGQLRAVVGLGALDHARKASWQLGGRWQQARIDSAEHAFTREDVTGAG